MDSQAAAAAIPPLNYLGWYGLLGTALQSLFGDEGENGGGNKAGLICASCGAKSEGRQSRRKPDGGRRLIQLLGHRVKTLWWSAPVQAVFEYGWTNASGAGYQPTSVCQQRVFLAQGVGTRGRLIAVEAFVPLGPIALYGLLGLRLDAVVSHELVVEVCPCLEPPKPFASIAGACDQVTVGLQEQFCLPVVEGIEAEVSASGSIPSGRLCVAHAATGAVGSCDLIMSVLARTAFKLFITEPMADEKVRTLVEAIVLSGVRQTG